MAHLALKSGAPIVPIGILGTDAAMPPGSVLPRRSPIRMRFGPPIDLGRWTRERPMDAVKREITDEVMGAIAALSGQQRPTGTAAPRRAHPIAV